MKLVLHNYWRSSSSHRVRIGLGCKHLAFEYVAVNLLKDEQLTDAHRAKNPSAQVPVLEIIENDATRSALTQSLPILEYLDERWPDPPLLPRDRYLRARTRGLAELVNAGIQPMQNMMVMRRIKQLGGDSLAWARQFISDGLLAFAKIADETAGAFCVGDTPTIADCFLVPQLASARRYQVELDDRFDRLLGIEARCLALPAFADAAPERQLDAVTT
ncbi:MAG TPA: maleylacetoacetate isomerase [Kofleriaceae bacterium]|jgi:maleylpyruvate isomerase|nr:maleylacetoacetate isomerase [Kofleriaceae bacterium]